MTTNAAVADATTTNPAGSDEAVRNMADLKKAVEDREKYKAKAKEGEAAVAELKALKEAQMSEQQKLAARIAELEPKAVKVERYETVIGALLESELATVPEEMRDVVPSGLAPEDRLDWLRQAKAKGLFKAPESAPAVKPTNAPLPSRPAAVGGNVITKSVLANMPNGPQRVAVMNAIREGKMSVIDG